MSSTLDSLKSANRSLRVARENNIKDYVSHVSGAESRLGIGSCSPRSQSPKRKLLKFDTAELNKPQGGSPLLLKRHKTNRFNSGRMKYKLALRTPGMKSTSPNISLHGASAPNDTLRNLPFPSTEYKKSKKNRARIGSIGARIYEKITDSYKKEPMEENESMLSKK